MREDSPAARMIPAKLGDRDMMRKIAERREKVSDCCKTDILEPECRCFAGRVGHHGLVHVSTAGDEVIEMKCLVLR